MRYRPEHRAESRSRILKAAGRGFRAAGFGGVGVDDLAKEAGVTSGAFYGHFRSKEDAFREAVVAGLEELRLGVEQFQAIHGAGWVSAFAQFYIGLKRTCDLPSSCALPSLSAEVERMGVKVRAAYEAELLKVAEIVAEKMPGQNEHERLKKAWALLGLLAGGVTLARAVANPSLSEQMAEAIIQAAILLVAEREETSRIA